MFNKSPNLVTLVTAILCRGAPLQKIIRDVLTISVTTRWNKNTAIYNNKNLPNGKKLRKYVQILNKT